MRIAIHGMRPSGQLRCPALLLQRSRGFWSIRYSSLAQAGIAVWSKPVRQP